MRKSLLALMFIMALSFSLTAGVAGAAGGPGPAQVVGTYTVADLGQGVWGGGSLRSDGTVSGNVAFSAGNGQFINHWNPTAWTYDKAAQTVTICFNISYIKGPEIFGPSMCASLPVTGTPVKVSGDDGHGFLMRVNIKPQYL